MLIIALGLLLGLMVGSFLNVVIYRLPVMMQRDWNQQCQELLATDNPTADAATDQNAIEEPFNLVVPRSRCSNCGTMVAAWQNIPVISWLLLRGKCASCKTRISARYPAIELLTGLLSAIVIWKFGVSPEGAGALFVLWSLVALTFIDIDHQLLPDSITYPLLWGGLAFSLLFDPSPFSAFANLESSVAGALVGYLSLWSVYWAFKLVTGKEGMGYGDFKLLAALGAWLGWQMIPLIIMLSAVVGTITGVAMILFLGRDRQIPIPFGPYLSGAGLIALLWGEQIVEYYTNISGL